jgi:hypothetical protein
LIPWQVYAGGAFIAFLLAVYFLWARALRKQGGLQQRAAAAEKGIEHAKDANKARTEIDRLPDGAAADRLRDKWSRD